MSRGGEPVWSKEEDNRLSRMISLGISRKKIAIKLNRSVPAIWQRSSSIKSDKSVIFKESYWELDLILMEVAKFYELHHLDIIQKNRSTKVRIARQICHKLAAEYTKLSYSKIAFNTGRLARTTIHNSLKKIEGYIDVDKKFLAEYEEIERIVVRAIESKKSIELKRSKQFDTYKEVKSSIVGIHAKIAFNQLINEYEK